MTDGENRRIYAGALLYASVAMVLVLLVAALWFLVRNAQAGSATRQLLIECTIPPSDRQPPVDPRRDDCYTRNIERQAEILGDPSAPINDVSIIAAACGSAHPGDIAATRSCVLKGLNR